MAIARTLEAYIARHGAKHDVIAHPRSRTSIETADLADVPGDLLLKAVVLKDDEGLLLAVLPSTLSVHIGHLTTRTDRRLRLADEDELAAAFPDCVPGAIPPLAAAYGLRTIIDDSIGTRPEVFFEAGDHEHLVHMGTGQFLSIVGPAERANFGVHERRLHR